MDRFFKIVINPQLRCRLTRFLVTGAGCDNDPGCRLAPAYFSNQIQTIHGVGALQAHIGNHGQVMMFFQIVERFTKTVTAINNKALLFQQLAIGKQDARFVIDDQYPVATAAMLTAGM